MDVTVLIRCYNHERYLYDCVRRLRNQKYVILDDYPPSGKRERLNIAIQNIDTEWIAFNDADDMSMEYRFELESFLRDTDLIYTDYYTMSKKAFGYCKSRHFDKELLKKENYIPFSTIVVKTEIAKRVPFEVDVNGNGEDWIWLNDVAKITDRFYYIPKPTMIYRNFNLPYGNIPIYGKIKRILYKRKVRKVINART